MLQNFLLGMLLFWWSITAIHYFLSPAEATEPDFTVECYEKSEVFDKWVPCGDPNDFGLNRVSCEHVGGTWIPHLTGCVVKRHLWYLKDGQLEIVYYNGKMT